MAENNLSLAPSQWFSRLTSYFAKHKQKTRGKEKKKKKKNEKGMPCNCHNPSESKDTYVSQVLRKGTVLVSNVRISDT